MQASCSDTFCTSPLHRYLFQDPASRLWWSGSFKHVYRAPQHAYLRWFTPAAPRGLPAAAAAAPPAPSFASAPLLAAPAAQLAAPAASRSQRLQALAREGLRALRARACEPVGLGLAAAEQLQLWRGRLASGADAAPGGASQRAMQWLRAKRQAYQLVLAHRVAAL